MLLLYSFVYRSKFHSSGLQARQVRQRTILGEYMSTRHSDVQDTKKEYSLGEFMRAFYPGGG